MNTWSIWKARIWCLGVRSEKIITETALMVMHYNTRDIREPTNIFLLGRVMKPPQHHTAMGRPAPSSAPAPSVALASLLYSYRSMNGLFDIQYLTAKCPHDVHKPWNLFGRRLQASRFVCRSVAAFLKEGKVKSEVGGILLWRRGGGRLVLLLQPISCHTTVHPVCFSAAQASQRCARFYFPTFPTIRSWK